MGNKVGAVWYAVAGLVWLAVPLFAFGASSGLVPCEGISCQLCSLAALVQNIINFAIGISIPIAAVLFTIAGLKYATAGGNPGKISDAHDIFTTVGVGFILTLSGWLVINIVLTTLVANTYGNRGTWFEISCTSEKRPTTNTLGDMFGKLFNALDPKSIQGGNTAGSGATQLKAVNSSQKVNCVPDMGGWGDSVTAINMACIEAGESACGADPYSKTDRITLISPNTSSDGQIIPVSAGPFMINLTQHELVCNGETLNCPSAFEGKYINKNSEVTLKSDMESTQLYEKCLRAAVNRECSTAAAKKILDTQGYGAWQAQAKACGIDIAKK